MAGFLIARILVGLFLACAILCTLCFKVVETVTIGEGECGHLPLIFISQLSLRAK